MRRIVCVVFIILALVGTTGCSGKNANLKQPVNAYYCTTDIKYNAEDGVIKAELQDFYNFDGDIRGFLNKYLSGPKTDTLVSPYPLGGWVLRFEQTDNVIDLTLNSNFSRLEPNELMLSYACLCMTLFDLTDAETVNIYISNTKPESNATTITRDSLMLIDRINTN